MNVVADSRERRSAVPHHLRRLGVSLEEALLPVGDYAIGRNCLIERKELVDLHQSIENGRLWTQIGKLRRAVTWPYLLVEGASPYDGRVGAEAVRGALLAIADLGVIVIQAKDGLDTALWIRRIATRREGVTTRSRRPFAGRDMSVKPHPGELALTAAPGISSTSAHRLVEHFGCLIRVLQASESGVRGIGRSRARAIAQLGALPSHSAKRNGQHRAT
ncbi:MAG: hypothetical protein H0X39_04280 [Actinobacteria bacterium]|nr:hypothetical protein [Actinomycetota bacterium]